MPPSSPLSKYQRRVLSDALRLVRDQRERGEAEGAPFPPAVAWTTPFALGYFVGVVDGLCQAHSVAFDGMGLAFNFSLINFGMLKKYLVRCCICCVIVGVLAGVVAMQMM